MIQDVITHASKKIAINLNSVSEEVLNSNKYPFLKKKPQETKKNRPL